MRFLRSAFSYDRLIGLAMLVGFILLYNFNPAPVEYARLKVFDYYQQAKPRDIPPPEKKPVTIIDIDEQSLETVGQWPWSRDKVAKLVQNAMAMKASVFAFDIVFAEPDGKDIKVVAEGAEGLTPEMKKLLTERLSNDELLAQVISKSRVVLGQAGRTNETEGVKGPPAKASVAIRKLSKNALDPEPFTLKFPALVRNIPILEEAAKNNRMAGFGMFNAIPDEDGVIRNIPAYFMHEGKFFPALAVEMLRVALGRQTVVIYTNEAGIDGVGITKNFTVKTNDKGRIWPHFSKRDWDKYVPAHELLNGTADPAKIAGRMLILGTSAVGLRDIRSIPTERDIPGVEVHAQVIEVIANQDYLTRPNYANAAEMAFVLFGGLAMIILVPWLGAKWTAMVFVVTALSAGGTSWYLFSVDKILLDASYAIVSIMLIYMVLTYTGYAREEAKRKQTRAAFSKYLSPDQVKRVAENPDALELGGVQRDMTLLFCDVRGFTTISEQFDAVGLTKLINKLLTPLTNVILDRHGTIDKYMGDCIMAFWNAPMDVERHAYYGCQSALAMMAEMAPLNERLEAEAIEEGRKHVPLKVGIGLNSGPAVVGNMGSELRIDYSVLGDTVNLAARLEGQSKAYGVDIVIGETTHAQVPELATLFLDNIKVKGKTEAVTIFCLVGDEEVTESQGFQTLKQFHNQMIEAYLEQDWNRAIKRLKECRLLCAPYNIDGFYDLYETRILHFQAESPGEDWDGVFVATTK
ncbi:MAG: adenylate/guanylate cyclase domain-containing protein [Rhodospirillales bacterium]|nr:adenylate/guanylate cyclase domain-containing protein [Rhodospirillales bacterium]